MIRMQTHLCQWDLRLRLTVQEWMEDSGSGQTVVRNGHSHPRHQRTGGPE